MLIIARQLPLEIYNNKRKHLTYLVLCTTLFNLYNMIINVNYLNIILILHLISIHNNKLLIENILRRV